MHQEEFYLQLLQEKDNEYNALVMKLKDRVIHLEQELQDTQRKAGMPVYLPYDSASLRLTPQMTRKQPPKRFQKLETGLSDTEISDLSPDGEDDKTATVERKVPVKDELDAAVPQHELLDTAVIKSKSDLVSRGGLAKRQLPSGKKSHSNSSSDCALNESEEEGITDSTSVSHSNNLENGQQNGHYNIINNNNNNNNSNSNGNGNRKRAEIANASSVAPLYAQVHKDRDSTRSNDNQNSNNHFVTHSTIPNIYKSPNDNATAPVAVAPAAPASVASYNNELSSSYDSILGSNDKLSDSGQHSDSWMYPSRRRNPKVPPSSFTEQLNQVLSDREQWVERNRLLYTYSMVILSLFSRRLGDGSSRDSSDDFSELNRSQTQAMSMSQTLLVEIRQAVHEAQPKGRSPFCIEHRLSFQPFDRIPPKNSKYLSKHFVLFIFGCFFDVVKTVIPQSLSPPGTVPWQQQGGPPSPSSVSSGSTSPGYSPSRTLDLSGSSTSFSSERKAPHHWQNGPVQEWSKDQVNHSDSIPDDNGFEYLNLPPNDKVCQWLLALGLEQYTPAFLQHGVEGGALLQLDSRDLKILGVTGDDKSKFKRKLKELKHIIEKEKRQQEKERKEREKMIRKAEKKAEKAAAKKK